MQGGVWAEYAPAGDLHVREGANESNGSTAGGGTRSSGIGGGE